MTTSTSECQCYAVTRGPFGTPIGSGRHPGGPSGPVEDEHIVGNGAPVAGAEPALAHVVVPVTGLEPALSAT